MDRKHMCNAHVQYTQAVEGKFPKHFLEVNTWHGQNLTVTVNGISLSLQLDQTTMLLIIDLVII